MAFDAGTAKSKAASHMPSLSFLFFFGQKKFILEFVPSSYRAFKEPK